MTATRDPDRLLRAWLDLMPDEAPDRVIASVLQASHGTRQRRALPWHGIRRTPRMNRLILIAATALLALALVGGAVLLSTGGPGPVQSTFAPTPTLAAASAGMPEPIAAPPQDVWGDWIADVPAIPEISMPEGLIQLSIDWENGDRVWLQTTPDYRQLLASAPLTAPTGELRLRSNTVENTPCASGSEGRYRWSRSTDGMFLTLDLIEDACAARALVFARTWVHSLGAVNDGGPGVIYGVLPMTQVTLPRGQRLAASSGIQWQEIKTFGDAQPFQAFVVVGNPGGFGAPCSANDPQKIDITHTTDAFIEYVKGLPGLSVTTSPTEIDGRPAIRFDYSVDDAVQCESGDIQAFHPQLRTDDFAWGSVPGELQRMYIVQMDESTTYLLWYQGNSETERQVIDSVRFIDELPTPPS